MAPEFLEAFDFVASNHEYKLRKNSYHDFRAVLDPAA